ncbi:MAG: hypothetical protein L3J28_00150 [Candidatus Polarisedimenticolaceae bacterium]|nr:hypothetical protein [Candidatus Polarisedimenticolaceae bacterium]
MEIVIKELAGSNRIREFIDGSSRSAEILSTSYVGLGRYKPGWKWSEHVGIESGKPSERHIGYIISGSFVVKGASGKEEIVGPGQSFELSQGHDAWVYGDVPCVALDFGCIQEHVLNDTDLHVKPGDFER